ncbi:MAG TPA: aspartate aminotransferase [Spirochaetia bacterium]|nr:MAG: aspartate aminotransferase [Spirochaetes bacterium GWB1_36_13]HCL55953.1 aspartate aminotransferase [Spirochaetia bacterium]
MAFNKRISSIAPSMTLGISAKAKEMKAKGLPVINFSAGEPDFDTPDYIKEACLKAIKEGKTKYAPVGGIPELKNAIIEKLKKDNGLEYTAGEIMVCVGAKEALFDVIMTIADEGDEVLMPAPYWVSYEEIVRVSGAKTVIVPSTLENNFKITVDELKKHITPKTKALIMNSPSNPTGSLYNEKELKELADFLSDKNIWVISDEIYEKIIYDNEKHVSIASFSPEIKKKTIVINGFSKSHSMTGWRLGYAAGPKEVISLASGLQGHATSGTPTFIQYAGVEALKDTGTVEKMRVEFEKRRNVIVEGLNKIKGFKCPKPQGAFYVFPDVSGLFGQTIGGKKITGSMDLCEVILEKANVAGVPGIAFGMDQNIRFSFATSLKDIEEGILRIKQLIEGVSDVLFQ